MACSGCAIQERWKTPIISLPAALHSFYTSFRRAITKSGRFLRLFCYISLTGRRRVANLAQKAGRETARLNANN